MTYVFVGAETSPKHLNISLLLHTSISAGASGLSAHN